MVKTPENNNESPNADLNSGVSSNSEDSKAMEQATKKADKARADESRKGGEIEYWKKEIEPIYNSSGKAWEGVKKVGRVIKEAPGNVVEGVKAAPQYTLEKVQATPRYIWEGGKMGAKGSAKTVSGTLGILTDTAWSSAKAGWKFIKKMGWGLLTLHPPGAKETWKEVSEEFDSKEKKEK